MMKLLSIMSFFFMFLKHPLSMSMMLISQTIIIALLTGSSLGSFFMSYIIMIIMISGMLVLFIYMSSVASNEKFKSSLLMTALFFMALFLLLFLPDTLYMNTMSTMFEMKEKMMVIKLFNWPISIMTIFMVIYLLMTMIAISNIVKNFTGPLRVKKYE
uniref:NADH dehydrogenase subunit 6 n=1 Tax=Urochela quadrinotata TaxID=1176167 RepID=L7NZQ9_UROQU|nr:NADH dehydrogenase subunit 6 [Urochela quadrinotata]AFI54783.1 NADH dehydrogenase subunit 6 [Urochela quadrinotata]